MYLSFKHCLMVVFLGATSLATSSAAIIYTENFDYVSTPLQVYNWNVNYGSTGAIFDTSSTTGDNVSGNKGSDGITPGYFGGSVSGTNIPLLLWTNVGSFGSINSLTNVTFALEDNLNTENIHLALEIGGSWYATNNVYNSNSWGIQTVTPSGTSWSSLTFVSNSSLSLGSTVSLPATGTIQAIGFYDAAQANTIRIDTIAVNAVPEPSVAVLFGLSALSLFWSARKRMLDCHDNPQNTPHTVSGVA